MITISLHCKFTLFAFATCSLKMTCQDTAILYHGVALEEERRKKRSAKLRSPWAQVDKLLTISALVHCLKAHLGIFSTLDQKLSWFHDCDTKVKVRQSIPDKGSNSIPYSSSCYSNSYDSSYMCSNRSINLCHGHTMLYQEMWAMIVGSVNPSACQLPSLFLIWSQEANVAIFTFAVLQNLIRMTRVRTAVRPRSSLGFLRNGRNLNKKDLFIFFSSRGPNTTWKHQTQIAIFALTVSFFKGHFLVRQRLVEAGLLLIVSDQVAQGRGSFKETTPTRWWRIVKCSHATKGFKGIIVFAFRSHSAPKPGEFWDQGEWC